MSYRSPLGPYEWLSQHPDTLSPAGRKAQDYYIVLRLATPKWYDDDKARAMVNLAHRHGKVIDHDVPLRNKHVCGLNCPDNYVIRSAKLNAQKSNHWWSDMPGEIEHMFPLEDVEQWELAL